MVEMGDLSARIAWVFWWREWMGVGTGGYDISILQGMGYSRDYGLGMMYV